VGWEQVGNTRGDSWYGRPARYVRRGAIIGSPTFSNFHSIYILTLKTRLDTRRSLMHTASSRPRHQHLPCMREHSLRHHFLRMQDQAGVEIDGFSTPFSPVPPPSHARASRRWFHGVSTSLIPPPPLSHPRSSRRGTFMVFPRRSRLFHLPCM